MAKQEICCSSFCVSDYNGRAQARPFFLRPGHMSKLVLTILDADHHYEDWTYTINGKASTDRFDMRKVKN
jgi:hypothetical protein